MKTPLWMIVGIVAGLVLAFGSSVQTTPTASACILFCDDEEDDGGDGLLDDVLEDDGLLDVDILEDEDDGDDGLINVDLLNEDDELVEVEIDTDDDGGNDLLDLEVDTDLLDDDDDGTNELLEVEADTSLLSNNDDDDEDLDLEIIQTNGGGAGNLPIGGNGGTSNLLEPVTDLLGGGNGGSNGGNGGGGGEGNEGDGDNGLIDLGDDQLLNLCLGIDPLDLLALAGEGCLQDNDICTLLNLNCLLGDLLEPVVGPDGLADPLIDLCISVPLVELSLEIGQGCTDGHDGPDGPDDGDDGDDSDDGNDGIGGGNGGDGIGGSNGGNGGGNTVTSRNGNPVAASAPVSQVQGVQTQRAGNFTVPNAGDGGLLGLKDGTTGGIAVGAELFATLLGLVAASRVIARVRS